MVRRATERRGGCQAGSVPEDARRRAESAIVQVGGQQARDGGDEGYARMVACVGAQVRGARALHRQWYTGAAAKQRRFLPAQFQSLADQIERKSREVCFWVRAIQSRRQILDIPMEISPKISSHYLDNRQEGNYVLK